MTNHYPLFPLLFVGTVLSLGCAIIGAICGYHFAWIPQPPGNAFTWACCGTLLGLTLGAIVATILGSLASDGFRYTIRDLVWPAVLSAVVLGWAVDRVLLVRAYESALQNRPRSIIEEAYGPHLSPLRRP